MRAQSNSNVGLHPEMKKCRWVTFLDCDEFITFRDRQGKGILKSFLSDVSSRVGLMFLAERRFGHNGHFWDPPLESLVINSFTRRENGAELTATSGGMRKTKTISRVHAIELPILSPHAMQLRQGFHPRKADETVVVNSHFFIRSFLRFLHRTIRGKVSHHDRSQRRLQNFYIWRFITSIVGLNNVEDRGLTAYADDIIDYLGKLGIWGHNRTERLRPYQLDLDEVKILMENGMNYTKPFVSRYTLPSPKPSISHHLGKTQLRRRG